MRAVAAEENLGIGVAKINAFNNDGKDSLMVTEIFATPSECWMGIQQLLLLWLKGSQRRLCKLEASTTTPETTGSGQTF
jgi:hypothetical protein